MTATDIEHIIPTSRRTARMRVLAVTLVLATVAAGCGGTKSGDAAKTGDGGKDAKLTAAAGEVPAPTGKPVRGGTIAYGLTADTAEGYCLPEAQLSASGIMVARTFYDTLTVPNKAGGYTPYLARSVTPNADHTQWTIAIRPGVTFSDGSKLTADVVRNNLDAYRGSYPTRKPLLYRFIFKAITKTEVVDPLTVRVTLASPWIAFPAALFSSGRLGIMGQAQLDDKTSCASHLVGTGPFVLDTWNRATSILGHRNAHYWQTAPDGKPYPYADKVDLEFKSDGQVRFNALRTHGINVMHTFDPNLISTTLKDLRDSGKVNMFVSQDDATVTFLQLNSLKPPFDSPVFRKAMALGFDRTELNQVTGNGLPTVADGPFGPDSPGYLKDPGFPAYDPVQARKLIKQYVASGGKAQFTLTSPADQNIRRFSELLQAQAAKIGVKVRLALVDVSTLIDAAIGKKYQAMPFTNYPGGEPDTNYVWWYGKGNPVNFAGYDDAIINDKLDKARAEPDAAKRAALYQGINRQFASSVHSIWFWYTVWAIAEDPSVHGVLGPPLPGDDASKPGKATSTDPNFLPSTGLSMGHSLVGMWVAK